MKSFFINNTNPASGPGIFGYRLGKELSGQGHEFTTSSPDNNICIIQGNYIEGARNILRLDGLYFDPENPDCDTLNAPIFECYKKFDHIVFQSKFSRDMYEAFTGVKRPNTIINNGINKSFKEGAEDIRTNHPLMKRFKKVCIASASWRRHKRLEEIIDTFRLTSLSDVLLLVLGGKDYEPLKNSRTFIPPSNVLLMPTLELNEIASWYCAADAMIHICMFDNCPNSVIEALSCGVPVLTSHNGGTKELIERWSGLVIKLEDDYKVGEMYPYYSPPEIDILNLSSGILNVLKIGKGFKRPDLDIKNVAERYLEVMK
jgi:glycosyltransferase involved in cell wall biosynthesis